MGMAGGSGKYEGCGEIGSIRAIFLAQFHPEQGPLVRCQWPHDFLSKENFESVSRFIIPKNEIQAQTVTVNCLGYKISGYPTYLHDKKYKRNYLLFNLCVVCYPWSRTVQFEPFIRKLSQFFGNLEKESLLLSRGVEDSNADMKDQIQEMLSNVYHDMNTEGKCLLVHGDNSLQLSVISMGSDPPPVKDYSVPILTVKNLSFHSDQWDLTTTQILPYVDGFNHIARISSLADVETNLVRSCVQNLVYHRVVGLVTMFQYTNVYTVTPELSKLKTDPGLRADLLNLVNTQESSFSFLSLYTFISSFTYGSTLKDILGRLGESVADYELWCPCLVQYLVLSGILRRVHRYPVWLQEPAEAGSMERGRQEPRLYSWFTGEHHTDHIAVATGLTGPQLNNKIEEDPNVLVLMK